MARHCLLLLSLLFASHPVFSQSVVISAPSTDITSRGEAMLAHERQFNRFQSGRYWNSFTFGTYGLSKNTELAATLYGVGRPASGWHWEATAGFMTPISFSGCGVGGWGLATSACGLPAQRRASPRAPVMAPARSSIRGGNWL